MISNSKIWNKVLRDKILMHAREAIEPMPIKSNSIEPMINNGKGFLKSQLHSIRTIQLFMARECIVFL